MTYKFPALFISSIFAISLVNGQSLTVEGEVTQPLKLSAADLSGMKRTDVSATDHDGKTYRYSGVPVADILARAGVPLGPQLRGKNLSKYLLVKASDGYQVVFALPELDTVFASRIIILADQADGKPLPAGKGPFRIIVPGEKKPARWIREVTAMYVRSAKE
jgi:DMSO/TMAO reductase YedYZ molybdopterin-dependent catalytic subunit